MSKKSVEKIFREDMFWKDVLESPRLSGISARVSKTSLEASLGDEITFANEGGGKHIWKGHDAWICADTVDGMKVSHRKHETLALAIHSELATENSEWDRIESEALNKIAEQRLLPASTSDSHIITDAVATNPFLLSTRKPSDMSSNAKADFIASHILSYVNESGHSPLEALTVYRHVIESLFKNKEGLADLVINKKLSKGIGEVFSEAQSDLDSNSNDSRKEHVFNPKPNMSKKKEKEETHEKQFRPSAPSLTRH